jgi:sugar-specific transcriptional regulator TrmB
LRQELLIEAGLNEREVRSIMILGANPKMKASELAKELDTTRLDAYNSLSRLQEMGIVTVTADRPMLFSSLNINQAIEHIIVMRKEQLNQILESYEAIKDEIYNDAPKKDLASNEIADPKFAVLKERTNIYSRLTKMAENAEEKLIISLGQYGILHLCRNAKALEAVNTAAIRGVVVQIITHLNSRTIRFYSELHNSIEVRHANDLESLGFVRDQSEVIQFLNIEENPVGRGKDDAALFIESEHFTEAHLRLIDTIWNNAVLYEKAVKRYTDNQITDPLRLTIGEGSFLKNISEALDFDGEFPEKDTPFDPEAFFAAGKEVNIARRKLAEGKLSNCFFITRT